MADHVDVRKRETNFNRKDRRSKQYKTFVGSQAEGQGFADKRKRKIHYEYLKLKKKEERCMHGGGDVKNKHGVRQPDTRSSVKGNLSSQHTFTQAQTIFQKEKEDKILKKKELACKKKEMDNALEKYKTLKKSRHMKLCKRTHKGQPVMRNQIEYLLDKIQKQVQQT